MNTETQTEPKTREEKLAILKKNGYQPENLDKPDVEAMTVIENTTPDPIA